MVVSISDKFHYGDRRAHSTVTNIMRDISMTILCMVYLSATHKNVADINDFGSTSFPFQKDIKTVWRSSRARSLNIC